MPRGNARAIKLPHSIVLKPTQPYIRRIIEAFKDFPPATTGLLESLLAIDLGQRGTVALGLKSEDINKKKCSMDGGDTRREVKGQVAAYGGVGGGGCS
ncbi:hypothetical protein Tco_0199772 [Tanacetum coccineum]